MDHLLDCILVIFAQVDDASVSFAKTIAACAIEKAAAGAQNGLVDGPLAVVAGDGQIGVLATEVKSVAHVSTAHGGCGGVAVVEQGGEGIDGRVLTSTKHSSSHYEGCCARRRPLRRAESARNLIAESRRCSSDGLDGARGSSDV